MNSSIDLCAIPAGVSPDGTHNFIDPPTLGPAVIAVGVVLGVISTTFAAARLFVNRNKLHSAEYFTIAACLWNIAYTGVITSQHRYYRHSWDIPVCWFDGRYLRLPFIQTVIFCPAFFFPKAAIFLLYRQLFGLERRFRVAVYVGLLVTLLTYLSNIPLAAIYAAPRVGESWDSLLKTLQANEHSFAMGGVVQSAVGTVLDFYIFFLPLPILAGLHLPSRQKWQLIGVFSTALLGIAASVVSLVFKVQILSSHDSPWLAALTSMCSLIETNIAIIVGCMPAFAQFVKVQISASTLFKSLRSRLLGSGASGSGSGASPSFKGESNDKNGAAPKVYTIGSEPRAGSAKQNYYEMTDTMLLMTQATVHGGDASETDQPSKPGSSLASAATEQSV